MGADPKFKKEVASYGYELRDDKLSARRLHILRECPKTFVSQFSHDVIQLHMNSVQFNNALPDEGGLDQQIAVVMEALAVVRDELHKVEAWRRHMDKQNEEKKNALNKKMRNRST